MNGETGRLLTMTGQGSGVSALRCGQVAADERARSRVRQSFEVDGQVLHQDLTTEIRIQPS